MKRNQDNESLRGTYVRGGGGGSVITTCRRIFGLQVDGNSTEGGRGISGGAYKWQFMIYHRWLFML